MKPPLSALIIWGILVALTIIKRRKTPGDVADFYTVYLIGLGISALTSVINFYVFLFCPAVYLPVLYCFKKPHHRKTWRMMASLCLFLSLFSNAFLFDLFPDLSFRDTLLMAFMMPTIVMFPLGVVSYIETYRRQKLNG